MRVLGIESSCDDTGIALVDNYEIVANVVLKQEHHKGVIPEYAARAHHQAIHDYAREIIGELAVDLVAYTAGPGLIGSLFVGACFAKGLAYSTCTPSIAVNHLHAHILLPYWMQFNARKVRKSGQNGGVYEAIASENRTEQNGWVYGVARDAGLGVNSDQQANKSGQNGGVYGTIASEGRTEQNGEVYENLGCNSKIGLDGVGCEDELLKTARMAEITRKPGPSTTAESTEPSKGIPNSAKTASQNSTNSAKTGEFVDLGDENALNFPYICLLISGGHTMVILVRDLGRFYVLSKTLDDAIGEVFDKVARHIGLDYPGGPNIEKLAKMAEITKPLPDRSTAAEPTKSSQGTPDPARMEQSTWPLPDESDRAKTASQNPPDQAKMAEIRESPNIPDPAKTASPNSPDPAKTGGFKSSFVFPKVMQNRDEFSFSGLKTAALGVIDPRAELSKKADFCYDFQEHVANLLVEKVERIFLKICNEKSCKMPNFGGENDSEPFFVKDFVIAGGVAANVCIRSKFDDFARKYGVKMHYPPIELCTDNGLMIAALGQLLFAKNGASSFDTKIDPGMKFW